MPAFHWGPYCRVFLPISKSYAKQLSRAHQMNPEKIRKRQIPVFVRALVTIGNAYAMSQALIGVFLRFSE